MGAGQSVGVREDVHAEMCGECFCKANGHLEVVAKHLVSKGADIHAGDDRALRWASERGQTFGIERGRHTCGG